MSECLSYFTKVLSKVNPNKIFRIPSWIPMLPEPTVQFNLDPPTYQLVTNVIRKMKTSGSSCPLDQLSRPIICFKRCRFLRTYLTELIKAIWLSGNIPDEWKKACTVLIYKKDNTNRPSNFRPIILNQYHLKYLPLVFVIQCLPSFLPTTLSNKTFRKDLLRTYQKHSNSLHKWHTLQTKPGYSNAHSS